MKKLLSPKQVARAIGVSESSLKRWCDRGRLRVEKTVGGHRRVTIEEVVRFVREEGFELHDAQALGLPAYAGRTEWTVDRARERFTEELIAGHEAACRQIAIDLYLSRLSISRICDEVISASMVEIGNRWDSGNVEVYQERRACELCLRLMHDLRDLLPAIPEFAPLALGATIDGDPYTVSVRMAALVLRSLGWNAVSLGNMLPFETIGRAVEQQHPKLLWLSVSVVRHRTRFLEHFEALAATVQQRGARMIVGGRVFEDADLASGIPDFVDLAATFQSLEELTRIDSVRGRDDESPPARSDSRV